MEILYLLNLAIALSLIVAPLWWSQRLLGLSVLNPVSILVICALPIDMFRLFVGQMVLGNGLMAPEYQFAVLMTNIQQSIALAILYFASRLQVTRKLPYLIPRFGLFQPLDLQRFSKVFFLLYIAAFLVLAMRTGGVADWLLDIRGSYIGKREGNGIFYAAAVSFLSVSYFFAGIASRRTLGFSLLSSVFFLAIYILGSKGFVLLFFVFYLIIVHRQERVNVGKVLAITLPIAFLLLLINFFSQRESVDLSSVAEYFDYYPNAAMYYADYFSGRVSLFEGKVILTSLWEYAPRSLFPDKPYVYGILHVVEIYYPGGAESGNTPAFYGGVPQFADFGILGVIMFALLNWTPLVYFAGLRYTLQDRAFLNHGPMSGRTIIVSLLLFAPAFGTFLPLGLLFMLLMFVIGSIKFVRLFTRAFSLSLR